MTIAISRPLGDLVAEVPARAAILERLGLDYCCHGQSALADACAAAGLDATDVARDLEAVGDSTGDGGHPTDPAALADHIEATHHRYLHRELPELVALATKVAGVHGERHPELAQLARLVDELAADLGPHMVKEERILFPAVRALAAGTRQFAFGTIGNPIRVMTADHDRAGQLLADVRVVAAGFEVPADGCASYRSLYERLEELERDTHIHIHLENNVLFPAAVALQSA